MCVGDEGEERFARSKQAAVSEEEGDKDEGKGFELWAVTGELGGFVLWAVTGQFSGVSCAWAWRGC